MTVQEIGFYKAVKFWLIFAMCVMVLPSVLGKDDDGKYSNNAWDATGGDKMDKQFKL